jgi:NADPH:quinone reductase
MYASYLWEDGKLEYGEIDKPKPGKGQVLIKVEAVPLNPSDLHCIEGKYAEFVNFEYPFVPGWEGSGKVIESGGGMHAWYMRGKRVAFSKCNEDQDEGSTIKIGGAMAQYCITNAYQWVPLDNNVTFEQGASFFVNPITAIGFVELVTKDRARAVVISAAASQLGKMMIRLFQNRRVTVIATVRKEDQASELRDNYNVEHIINTEEDFEQDFKALTRELNAKHLLEWIGGSVWGKLISNMPKSSVVYLYGNLSRQKISDLNVFCFLASEIVIKPFKLDQWLLSKNICSILCVIRKVKRLIRENLKTDIQREFDLRNIHEAIEFYQSNMSGGKVLLKPWGVEFSEDEK